MPFSWFEPMWLENLGFAPEGEGWKLTEAGETAIGGRIPFNPSGGVLSSNPIGASGMIRFAEAAIQVMGKAGDHQVEGARKALGHAYGGGSQYYSMWVVGADKPVTSLRCSTPARCAMCPIDQLVEIAKTAEEVGFDSIALPDSIFYMEKQSADYPYTADGSRMWDEDTPWVDPLIAAGAMGAVTSTLRFYTNVMKLGSRNPLLLARQVGSVANLTNNRFGFGVGIGWAPEEFEWCGVPYAKRGKRVDEMIEVIKLVLGGGMVEFHGEFYDFDKLQMSPAPSKPVPFYVGGHTDVALRRAARVGDGWTSAMMTGDQLAEIIGKLKTLLAENGRADEPFEYQAVCIDKFGVDGHRELAEAGVTDNIVMPWVFDGLGFDAPLEKKQDSMKRFADTYIHSGWQD